MYRSTPLTLYICICSTTTTEAAENQAKLLQEQTTEILQSHHAHSVLLRKLISRLDNIQSSLTGSAGSTHPSSGPSSALSSAAPSTGSPSDNRGNSDNASIMSKRSALSLRLGRPAYIEDLKASRAYKRLRHFGLGIDSSSDSVLTFDSGCSVGNWSVLSDMTLGDLSISQIAVLNLPIGLTDVCNPEPFLESGSAETHRSSHPRPRRIWSSRRRIHNAIENGNEFVVRTVLTMGMDIEELDSNGRTPLVHAIMKHQGAICKLLLEKGACGSGEALKSYTSGMDLKERSELLNPFITRALDDGTSSVYGAVLRLLVQMALGTNYGDDNRSSGRSMMRAAIDMGYDLAIRAIIHLEPRVLVEVDTEGRTPFAYAYHLQRNEICEMLLQSPKVDREIATEVVKSEGNFSGHVHAVIEEKCLLLLRLQLLFATSVDVDKIGTEGHTPLSHATEVVLNSDDIDYGVWNDIFKALLGKASRGNLESVKKIKAKATARQCIATSMHEIVRNDYKSILVLLSLTGSRDAEGWTPLASAAFNLNEFLCEFLVENGCSLCLDTEQKEQLKRKLSCRIHAAAAGGHHTALQLLLDMGADISERNSDGEPALLSAVIYNHLSCVKVLIEGGADSTILTNYGASVLHLAAWKSTNGEMMRFLLDEAETRNLVNMKDTGGNTPLHDCSCSGRHDQSSITQLENTKMLLQVGASLTIKNSGGKTPYEYARFRGRKGLAKYLWSQLSPEQQAQEKHPPSNR